MRAALALIALALLAPATAAAGNGKSALRALPADVESVMTLNVARVKKSPHFGKLIALVQSRPDTGPLLDRLRAAGLDPQRDVATVVIGMPLAGAADGAILIVEGSFDARAVAAALADSDDGTQFAAVGKRLAIARTAQSLRAVIAASRNKRKSALANTALIDLIGATDTGKDIWFATRLDAAADRSGPAAELTAATGSADVQTGGVALAVQLIAASDDAAASIKSQLEMMLGLGGGHRALGPVLKKVTVSQSDNRLDLGVRLSKADVQALTALVPALEKPAEAAQ